MSAVADADVVVVGAGPAGLSAAVTLRAAGVGRVLVLEREAAAGGIPRHAEHQGFGVRDLRRVLAGPDYARRLAARARDAGAEIRVRAQVTGVDDGGGLEITSPRGRERLRGDAVLLATGCRERPRSARLIAGDRPAGVMTTGTLQQLVAGGAREVGERALVVGAEHVSFSALATLRHGGARAIAMTTELASHQSYAAFALGARIGYRTPLRVRTALREIHGRDRVEGVTLLDLDRGETREEACDLVVLTGDWIPDHELAVRAGVALDDATRGPRVDAGGRTTRPGWFAAGNLLRGAETADVAALEGRHVARAIAGWLRRRARDWPPAGVALGGAPPLDWIAPGWVSAGAGPPSRGRFLLRAHEPLRDATVELRQDGRVLRRLTLPRISPGRSAALPWQWAELVDPAGGPVVASVTSARRGARRAGASDLTHRIP